MRAVSGRFLRTIRFCVAIKSEFVYINIEKALAAADQLHKCSKKASVSLCISFFREVTFFLKKINNNLLFADSRPRQRRRQQRRRQRRRRRRQRWQLRRRRRKRRRLQVCERKKNCVCIETRIVVCFLLKV